MIAESKLRPATEGDLEFIQRIYNEVIMNSTATFEEHPRPIEEWQRIYQEKIVQNRPLIVAEVSGEVVGFGTFYHFRGASGYRTTVENSLHVAPEFRGRGIGTLILLELIRRARELGYHAVVAAVDTANLSSISLHEKHGFVKVGEIPEVGMKFSKWLSLTLLQLIL